MVANEAGVLPPVYPGGRGKLPCLGATGYPMTVAIAWVRKIRDCEELVFVSDSRLSGDGRILDVSPKILTLPRTDCAICFGGETEHAFPMMLQLALAIDAYGPARRSLQLSALKQHALKVFGDMAKHIKSTVRPRQSALPGAHFLFGGYCWIKKRFELWTIHYNARERQFVADPAQWMSYSRRARAVLRRNDKLDQTRAIGRVAFAGDAAEHAKSLLLEVVNAAEEKGRGLRSLDMQPFNVVRDMLRNPGSMDTIGGAPQLVKVYQYMQSAPLAVYWPDRACGRVYIHGRPCLGYEHIDRWIIDPDSLQSERPLYSRHDVEDAPEPQVPLHEAYERS